MLLFHRRNTDQRLLKDAFCTVCEENGAASALVDGPLMRE
jgi:hypothetical protein